jgi:hypothetical protein
MYNSKIPLMASKINTFNKSSTGELKNKVGWPNEGVCTKVSMEGVNKDCLWEDKGTQNANFM